MAAAESPPVASFKLERRLYREGRQRVCGVDEAGRGPLAGPVVAAAVVLDPKRIPKGIADSKILDREKREAIFVALCATAEIAVASGCSTAIDRINILQCTMKTMRQAIAGLATPVDMVLIDGNVVPKGLRIDARAIVDGDALCLSIAAASIVAKVIRDRMMVRCDKVFDGYGLASHKGYSTKAHQTALTALGPTRIHRRSFAPVAAFFPELAAEPELDFSA